MMRKIPTTMATQHPDHANVPYWHDREFIRTNYEPREAYFNFSELGVDEYKWDWEGKLVDESVIERLLSEYYDFFKDHPIGQDKFITFRLPNPKVETEFRLGRALMTLLSASSIADHMKLYPNPLFEVILPLTETARELVDIQEAFRELAGLKHKLFRLNDRTITHIEMIPLFEDVQTIARSAEIVREYVELHTKTFGSAPRYVRPYIARSDPTLNSGLIATMLAMKIALSGYRNYAAESGIPMYPIVGVAALPFRGSLTPYSVKAFANEYRGVRTTLLQSAFRYDFPKDDVIKGIKELGKLLPKTEAVVVPADDQAEMMKLIPIFEQAYRPTVEAIAETINRLASQLPRRRERVQHIGLFGYSRGVGKVKLPRAIGFCGALYSLGVPPEFIGTGRGLRQAKEAGKLPLVERYYVNLRADLERAGRYINHEVLAALAAKDPAWADIQTDIAEVAAILDLDLTPKTQEEHNHLETTSQIYQHMQAGDNLSNIIEQAARLRHSMG